jgi:CheY-like chemotaxis protein
METNPKILIVDDNQDTLQLMLNCLFKAGYLNVLCAKNGISALDIIDKELPDLIILDWNMPVMNGIEVLKRLQSDRKTKHISVIIATGALLSSRDLEEALSSGANDYIRIPYEDIELLARVQSALNFSFMLKTITEQKKCIEEKNLLLEENNKRLVAFISASNEACIFVEKDLIIEANQVFYNFTGYTNDEVIGHSCYNFFPKEFQKRLIDISDLEGVLQSVSLFKSDENTLPVDMVVRQFEYNSRKVRAISFVNLSQPRKYNGENKEVYNRTYQTELKELKNSLQELRDTNSALLNQLQLKTLQNARDNDLMMELSAYLDNLKDILSQKDNGYAKQIDHYRHNIKEHLNSRMWNEFKLRFADVHYGFYDRLIARFPTLTETDLRLCAFIKLKMSTKEIALLINRPVNSVKVARNRLRRKLHIEDESQSLLTFLANY